MSQLKNLYISDIHSKFIHSFSYEVYFNCGSLFVLTKVDFIEPFSNISYQRILCYSKLCNFAFLVGNCIFFFLIRELNKKSALLFLNIVATTLRTTTSYTFMGFIFLHVISIWTIADIQNHLIAIDSQAIIVP